MRERRFFFDTGNLALAFVDTVGWRGDATRRCDYLAGPGDAIAWARQARLPLPPGAALAPSALVRLGELREAIARLVDAACDGAAPAAADLALLNRRSARAGAARLAYSAQGWKLAPARKRGSESVITAAVTEAAVKLLGDGEARGHLRRCHDPACGWLFLDLSQAARRRWCSMAECGNRDKARRHRRRALSPRKPARA